MQGSLSQTCEYEAGSIFSLLCWSRVQVPEGAPAAHVPCAAEPEALTSGLISSQNKIPEILLRAKGKKALDRSKHTIFIEAPLFLLL